MSTPPYLEYGRTSPPKVGNPWLVALAYYFGWMCGTFVAMILGIAVSGDQEAVGYLLVILPVFACISLCAPLVLVCTTLLLKRLSHRKLIKRAVLCGGILGTGLGFGVMSLTNCTGVSDKLDESYALAFLLMATEFFVLPTIVGALVTKSVKSLP